MSNISEIVNSLENRIKKMLQEFDNLKQINLNLEEELRILKAKENQFLEEIEKCHEECSSLRLANSILGSDQYKRDTKLKINALVREIDQCISQLSE